MEEADGQLFDKHPAPAIGLRPGSLKLIFFVLLSASVVAALETVGPSLVIAMVVTPCATAYPLCNRFPRLLLTSVAIGSIASFSGVHVSHFLYDMTIGILLTLQTTIFLTAFVFAPKHGLLASKRKARETLHKPAITVSKRRQ